MEEIKKEILSLSEKYSIKCVESANLEEELKTANSQLAQAQQQIIQLDSRYVALPKSFKTVVVNLFFTLYPSCKFSKISCSSPLKKRLYFCFNVTK